MLANICRAKSNIYVLLSKKHVLLLPWCQLFPAVTALRGALRDDRVIIILVYMGDWLLHASYQNIRHLDAHKHKPIWSGSQSQSGLMAPGFCVSVWMCAFPPSCPFPYGRACARNANDSLSNVMYGFGMIILGYEWGAESNLLCFLCAHRVHFLSSTIQTRQMTECSPSVSLPLSGRDLSLLCPLTSHSTPFAKDYSSYKFGIMDHVVLEWQTTQHWE